MNIQELAQACYDQAKAQDRPTRVIAETLVAQAPMATIREMAVEYLVDLIARAQRADALEAERAAERRPTQRHESAGTIPRKGSKARDWWETNTEEGRAYRADMDAIEFRHQQMLSGVIAKALERYAEDLKMEWTAELLDSTFALRDGTSVAWGDATAAQHEERKAMFLDNAHANMEGAARHEHALRALAECGAETLRECVRVTA